MLPETHNLRSGANPSSDEVVTLLLQGARFTAEHIASYGAVSPADFWYDQELPEWVMLLTGTASLGFESGTLDLQAGDYLIIPAHMKHRVTATSTDATWLALHFQP